MSRTEQVEKVLLKDIQVQINDSEILHFLYTKNIDWKHVDAIKQLTGFNDGILSSWLNVSVKTFREYKKPGSTLKENTREQVLLLLTVIKHGMAVFSSINEFDTWLHTGNFYFDNKSPATFMNTVTGIKYVDDRLTAMEHGDNI